MNNLKRLFVSIKSQVDQVADEFENHEALAGAAILDLQAIGSKTRLHLHKISKLSQQYQEQLEQQQELARLWSERAIKARKDDEQKALQCVKRLRQAQQQIALLEKQCEESAAQELKIRNDLNAISEQLQVLQNKKEILAARQNRASVQESLNNKAGNPVQEVNNIFERWEGRVVSSEFEVPDLDLDIDTDNFANKFEQEEDDLALKKMLDELSEDKNSSENNQVGEDHVRK
jgi:phage shock protein A